MGRSKIAENQYTKRYRQLFDQKCAEQRKIHVNKSNSVKLDPLNAIEFEPNTKKAAHLDLGISNETIHIPIQ